MGDPAGTTRVEVCELDQVTVPIVSATLLGMGLTLNGRSKLVSFQNMDAGDIRVARGRPAVATDFQLFPTAGTTLRVSAPTANTLQFISIGGVSRMNVQQVGDE